MSGSASLGQRCPSRPIACSSTASSPSGRPSELFAYLAGLGISDLYASPLLQAREKAA